MFNTFASAQSVDSVSANLSVFLGTMSKLLKTLLFLHFQMYTASMQTGDHPYVGELSQRDDPYL